MKKILLISNMYPSESYPFFGTFIKNIESNLQTTEPNFERKKIDKIVIDKKSNSIVNKIFIYASFYLSITLKILFHRYDYIYVHFISHSAFPIILLSKFRKLNIVSHIHGGDIKNLNSKKKLAFKIKKKISQKILSISKTIIFPSRSYFDYANLHYIIPNDSVIKIYPSGGVAAIFFDEGTNFKSSINIKLGYAGRLISSKNIEPIIEALHTIPNSTLEIVGEGVLLNALKTLVIENKLNERVKFINAKSQIDLKFWFDSIDVLIYPSSSESLGLVPLEAIASNVFPILSDIPAFNEFSNNGIISYTLIELTPEAISKGVMYYMNLTPSEKQKILKDNKSICYQIYSSEMTNRLLHDIFK
ncbi:glycosyltransferase family 4 protein [Providencia rettgeri]|uniref:glycosyltransferase family 4 protein n=1 Tax=Providencia rettgeri TaxID=587 RepID=UPI00068A4AAC|nr:glycosyltransferase family 4 protein [Providencia rettgeri]